jgi:hypothetical protein
MVAVRLFANFALLIITNMLASQAHSRVHESGDECIATV